MHIINVVLETPQLPPSRRRCDGMFLLDTCALAKGGGKQSLNPPREITVNTPHI